MQDHEIPKEIAQQALWSKGLLKWTLWPQQEVIYEQIRGLPKEVQTVVVLCARQFGKSYLGTTLAVEDCLRNPGVSVLVVGPTIKQTIDIVHQSMRNLMAGDCPEGLIQRSKSEFRWYVGASELIVGGFDINNATRQRGKTIYRIYIEEVVDAHPDDYLESIRSDLGPSLTHSPDGKLVFLTTLPRIPDHPFITQTIPEAQAQNAFFSYTIEDNRQLSPEQKQACVVRSGGVNSVEYRREYMNEMVRDQSIMVVPEYNEAKHVGHIKMPTHYFPHITIDWGGVKDKTVALLHTYDFYNNRYMWIKEKVFEPNTDTKTIADSIKEWTKFDAGHPQYPAIHVDAPGQIVVDLISQYGLDVKNVLKEDWLSAVNQMAVKFCVTNHVIIAEECTFLRLSLRSGTFNRNRTDFERTKTLGHCDALAAMMYGFRVQSLMNPYAQNQMNGGMLADKIEIPDNQTRFSSFQPIGPKRFGAFR